MDFPTIEHGTARLKDFKIEHVKATTKAGRLPTVLTLKDKEMHASQRFYTSLLSRFALSDNVFQYYSPQEVLARVAKVRGDTPLHYAVEKSSTGDKLLAVSNPTMASINLPSIAKMFKAHGAIDTSYCDGIVQAKFLPGGKDEFDIIGGDEFQKRFALQIPVDNYGNPCTYIEMMRLLCENGMIGYGAAFRQMINPGKKPVETLERTLSTYSGAGFKEFRDRLEASQQSQLSVREAQWLREIMKKHPVGNHLLNTGRYDRLVGDFMQMYGLTNTDQVSAKRQSLLPAKCRVYDLINFSTELSTHHSYDQKEQRAYAGFLGGLLCSDFDMEGTATTKVKFPKFVIPDAAGLKNERAKIDEIAERLRVD